MSEKQYLCLKCGWTGGLPLNPHRFGNGRDVICPRCPYSVIELREMPEAEQEEQRRSFVFGNASMSNPRVTREMVDEAAERLDRDAGGATDD